MAPFVLLACEKSNNELGLEQVIGDQATLADTSLEVLTYTLSIDSTLVALPYESQELIGGYVGNRLVGSLVDPNFGRTASALTAEMLLTTVNIDFGSNPLVDSVGLYLRYDGVYGDTSSPMSFEVHQLSERLSRDTTFYSSYRAQTDQLISLPNNIVPRPNSNVTIGGVLTTPTLGIPLNPSFFQQNFADVGDGSFAAFSSQEDFLDYFKGIHVSTTTESGAILYFDLSSSNSVIRIYYHNDEADSLSVSLNFSQGGDVLPMHFSEFDHDFDSYPTGFDLSNVDSVSGEENVFVQSMGGVVTILEIPGLANLTNQGILINQATLEITKKPGAGATSPPPSRLELRTLSDEGGPGSLIKDFQFTFGDEGDGFFRSEPLKQGKYRFRLTRYIFEVANGGNGEKLMLLPAVKSTAANRVVLTGGKVPDSDLKMKIYFTKP
jgi:hypothetical protein